MSIYTLTLSDQTQVTLLLSQSSRFSIRIFNQSSLTGGRGGGKNSFTGTRTRSQQPWLWNGRFKGSYSSNGKEFYFIHPFRGLWANSSSILRAKRTGRDANHPPPSSTEVCACTVCHGENLQWLQWLIVVTWEGNVHDKQDKKGGYDPGISPDTSPVFL